MSIVKAAKGDFLVLYDYGSGGVWARISGISENEILVRYPVLKIINPLPAWMSREDYAELFRFDIQDPPPDWLVIAMQGCD